MNRFLKSTRHIYFILVCIINLTRCHDQDPTTKPTPQQQPDFPKVIGFTVSDITLNESQEDPISIEITLEDKAPTQDTLIITIENISLYNTAYRTIPYAKGNELRIPITKNENKVVFRLKPMDNEAYKTYPTFTLRISHTPNGFSDNHQSMVNISIVDDELATKLHRYETINGIFRTNQTYEYDIEGKLIKNVWESFQLHKSSGVQLFTYDEQNRLIKIYNDETYYQTITWDGNKLHSIDTWINNEKKSFTKYNYNSEGLITETLVYSPTNLSEYVLDFSYTYQYSENDMLQKLVFYKHREEKNLLYHKSFSYEEPLVNPLPLVQTINLDPAYKYLSTNVIQEMEDGTLIQEESSVEFDERGRLFKRITAKSNSSETAHYLYYPG